MSDKTSDGVLFYDAKRLIDQRDFNGAIQKIQSMTIAGQTDIEVQEVLAGAYAGACGLEFLDFFSTISSGSGGATNFFTLLMKGFTDRSTVPDKCTNSEAVMKGLGANATLRTGDQNFFMAILAMAKVGSYIRYKADVDGANANGDGTPDATIDPCVSAAASDFSDADMTQIVTGFGLILENFAAVSSVLSGGGASLTNTINTLADNCKTANGGQACLFTNETDVTDIHRRLFRRLLADKTQGIGQCDTTDPLTPICCMGLPFP